MSQRDDDADHGGEEDHLFDAVTAAVSRPSRDPVEEPQEEIDVDDEMEPEPEPERDTRYDDMFYDPTTPAPPVVDAEPDHQDGGQPDGQPDERADEQADDIWDGPPPKTHRVRNVVLVAALLIGLAYVAGYFVTGLRMPAGTTIAGVEVSGTPAAARTTLARELEPRTEETITLKRGEKELQIEPADAGLALDPAASVAGAGGQRSWDPRDMAALLFGENAHDAVVSTDMSKFGGVLGSVGEAVDVEVVEAQITFPDAKPKARSPKNGEVVDRPATTQAVKDSFVGVVDDPVEVVTKTVLPAVDQAGLDAAMQGVAKTAVSAPVAIEVGDKSVELPVTAYAPALVIRVENRALTPYIDPKKLAKPLTDSTTGIGKKAVDATVKIEGGKPVVVPGKEGLGLQPEEMSTKLLPAIAATGDDRSVSVEAKVVDPEVTTADAKAYKITEKIGDFETQFPYAEYRNINQGRAAKLVDGIIVKPGETFSFNDTVGERTEANGFTTGTVINGGVFREELGGGVSQTVTTMYNAAFFGGMDDVEHHPHAFYISRYPAGREATVYYGNLDLRWKNPTKYGVLIQARAVPSTPSSPGRMQVELWSTKVWDKVEAGSSPKRNFRKPGKQYDDSDKCVAQAPIEGFDIDIYRTFIKDGRKAKSETDKVTYQAADNVICGKKPE